MVFADLKNDFMFRRIFGTHPDILRGLLDDLLERAGDAAIETIEYLPSEQLPLAAGARLRILAVRCKDRGGNRFVVEMQLIHVKSFIQRVVDNACEAYVDPVKVGKPYSSLTDVVVISICDFDIWPDAERDREESCPVPMLSRWFVTERSLRADRDQNRFLHVQYAFLELPKLPVEKPASGAALWAWLFVHAPELTEIPADLPPGPHRAALDLANEARLTPQELDAYRKAMDEIQPAMAGAISWGHDLREEIAPRVETSIDILQVSKTLRETIEKGIERGIEKGIEKGRREAVLDMLRRLFVRRMGRPLTEQEQQALAMRATREASDPADMQEHALSLEGEALAAWLLDPSAK